MSHLPKPVRFGQSKPSKERRALRGTPGSTRWLKGLLARPVVLERRDGHLRVTLAERRRAPAVIEHQERNALCEEVRALMLRRGSKHEVAVMRHLALVLDVLQVRGWEGVGAMASGVLRKALMQTQLVQSRQSTLALEHLVERLRLLHVAAGLREDRKRGVPSPDLSDHAEVTEASHEEFEAMRRNWATTVSPALSGDDQAS
jgi:hypothetical protein